jgi:hypothetical protein
MAGGGQTTANNIGGWALNTGRTPATDVNQLQQIAAQQRNLVSPYGNTAAALRNAAALNAAYQQNLQQQMALSTSALNIQPGQAVYVPAGQQIQNVIMQTGGGGGGYLSGNGGGGGGYVATSYVGNALGVGLNPYTSLTSGTGGMTATSPLGNWTAAKPPIFDPRWYNDYLEAREDAVVRRLEG